MTVRRIRAVYAACGGMEDGMTFTNESIYMTALRQSAADAGCSAEDFLKAENVIVRSVKNADARKYLELPFDCNLISYGNNIVASVNEKHRDIVSDYINKYSAEHCFETPNMHVLNDEMQKRGLRVCFMAEYFLPDLNFIKQIDCNYSLRLMEQEDFAGLYGLTKGDYDRLRPYIRIAEEFRLMSDLYPEGVPVRDSIPKRPRQEKFPEGTTVELNAADTAVLKKIPGIGSYYARRIVDYRDRLGGFVSVGQLAEVEDLPEGLERWFTVSPSVSRPLRVNRMSLNALRRHPYLDFYQSKVIVEHRRKYGAIKSLQALSLYEEFAPSDLERLQPYVSFEE